MRMGDLLVAAELEVLLKQIDVLHDKPIKLWSTVKEILGYVKILELEQHDKRVSASSLVWLKKVQKAARYGNHLLDPAKLASIPYEKVEELDSAMHHHLWSRFNSLFQERNGLAEIQPPPPQTFDVGEPMMLFGSREIFGREREREKIAKWIVQKEDSMSKAEPLSTLSIYGEEGIGKTSLARFFFDDEIAMERFRTRAWVSATWDEVDLVSIGRGIVASASGLSCLLDDLAELDIVVRDSLQCSRAFIVLDNIELMEEKTWMHMLHSWFCVLDSGSKVILTTSSKKVSVMADQLFELGRLPHDASWSLFSSIAFDASKFDEFHLEIAERANYIVVARTIAACCLGNPLLLKIWGTLLRFGSIIETEGFLAKDFHHKNGVTGMLEHSYWCLPDPLRECLGFCALYPKGCTLNKDCLIQMWTAHGLIPPRALENGLDPYFHQLLPFLVDCNWNENGDFTECRLPGLIHDLLQNVTGIASRNEGGLVSRMDKNGCQTSLEFITESLAIPLGVTFNAGELRTLLVSGKYLGNLNYSISRFKCVRVLDLSSTGISKLTSRIDTLKQLTYLDLSHTLISRLPDSITSIKGLQTLKLSGCHNLQKLPKEMHSLINLRYLEMELCDSLLYLPSGIGKLTCLQSLSSLVLGQEDKCARLSELQSLKQLKGKLAIQNLENVRNREEAKDAKLQEKKGLEHLKFSWTVGKDESSKMPSKRLLEYLVPHSELKSLDIHGYTGYEFPSWVRNISSLTKVSIRDCGCSVLPPLGQLPNLKELILEGISKIVIIGQQFYGQDYFSSGFPSLEHLEFRDMPSLSDWDDVSPWLETGGSYAEKPFPCLKTLTIEACPNLMRMARFPALESLVISNSNNNLLSSLPHIPSLSSLVLKMLRLKDAFVNVRGSMPVDKLVLYDCSGDLDYVMETHRKDFASLAHLGIFSCHDLKYLDTRFLSHLQKLDIVDCPNLRSFKGRVGYLYSLKELVLDGCPALESLPNDFLFSRLEKLIIKRCPALSTSTADEELLRGLKYLFVSGCPKLEKMLQTDTAHIDQVVIFSEKGLVKERDHV